LLERSFEDHPEDFSVTIRRQLRQAKHQAARQQKIRAKTQLWRVEMQTAITRFQAAQKARIDRWKALFPVFLPLNLSRLPSFLQAFVAAVGKILTRGQTIRNKLTAAADTISDQLGSAATSLRSQRSARRTRQLRAGHVNLGWGRSKKAKAKSQLSNRAKLASLRNGFESLEERRVLAGNVWVNDNWSYSDVDMSGTLNTGDLVSNVGQGDAVTVSGLEFGTDAFLSISDAINLADPGRTINVAGGTYLDSATLLNGEIVNIRGSVFYASIASNALGALNLTTQNLELTGNSDVVFDGTLSGSGGTLTKSGSGKLTITKNNTGYSSLTAINAGSIEVQNSGALGSSSVSVNNTAALRISNVSFNNQINLNNGSTLLGIGNAILNYGSSSLVQPHIAVASAASVTFATLDALSTLQIGSNTNRLQGGSGSVVNVSGLGAVVLTQNNNANFEAKWNVDNSTLRISSDLQLGVIPGSSLADSITLRNGGQLVSTATTTIAANRGITLADTGGILNASTGDLSIASVVTGSAGITTLSGAGAVLLSNTGNNYSGGTTVSTGTLRLAAAGVIPNASDVVINSAATLDLNGFSETIDGLSGAGTVNATSGTPTLTVGSADANAVFSGNIAGGGGTVILQKIGNGLQSLNGNVSTGATSIDGGVLNGSGSLTATSGVSVNNGGTLAGTLNITGNVMGVAGSNITPGTSPGILTITGNLTTAGNIVFDVNSSYSNAGVDFDQLVVNGMVNLNNAQISFVNTDNTTPPAANAILKIIDNNGTSDQTTFAGANLLQGAVVTFGSGMNTRTFRLFYNGGDGNDVVLIEAGTTPTTVYVDDAWSSFTGGETILDIDPVDMGSPTNGIFGINAFSSLQAAIDAVQDGATIFVNGGVYNQIATINKPGLTIKANLGTSEEALFAPTIGSQQSVITVNAPDVTIDGLSIQVNQGDDPLISGTAPIAPVGISGVGAIIDGLKIKNTNIVSIGDNPSTNWATNPTTLSTRAAGIVLVGTETGTPPSITLEDNQVEILSGSSFFQRAVVLEKLQASVTGNTFAGLSNDLVFRFTNGGTSTISGNTFAGVQHAGGAGVEIGTLNAPLDLLNNTFAPIQHVSLDAIPRRALKINLHSSVSSPITVSGNAIGVSGSTTIAGIGVDVLNSTGVIISNNIFTPIAGKLFTHVRVNSQSEGSTLGSITTVIDTVIQGNTFKTDPALVSGTAIQLVNALSGAAYSLNGVVVGGNAPSEKNIYQQLSTGTFVKGIEVIGGVATINDNVTNATTGIDVSGGVVTVSGGSLTANTTGIRFGTTGSGSVTGVNFDGVTDNATDLQILSTAGTVSIGAGNIFAGENLFIDNQSNQSYNLTSYGAANFEGLDPTLLPSASSDNYRIEDKIFHKVDDSNKGLVTWVANNVYVTDGGTDNNINRGIFAASAGDTVNVEAGTYDEDVNVNKANLKLLGAGPTASTISGPIGGAGSTVAINASGVEVAGFKITRAGNNTIDWNNPGLNSAGVSIQGQTLSGTLLHDNLITGMRTAIDINNSNGHTIRNNVIDDNRTGVILRNQTDNLLFTQNEITDNWTVGILFLDESSGSNIPVQQAVGSVFTNNNISGNWYGQVVDRQVGGALPAAGTNKKDFSGNWFGTNDPDVSTANSTEPGYAAQIPVAFGGSAVPPGGQPDILGPASANVDYTYYLDQGTDTNVSTGWGTYGFQGNFNALHVIATGAQVGPTGRISEAINAATSTATIYVHAGSYTDNVSTAGKAITLVPGNSPGDGTGTGQIVLNGNLALDANDTLSMEILGTNAATQYDNFVVTGTVSLGGASITLTRDMFAPFPGDSFTLIDNDSTDAIMGTFNLLPEGSIIYVTGIPFTISYVGGVDNNDVVLTIVQPNTVWVNDNWVMTFDADMSGGLTAGDTVANTGLGDNGLVTGKTFGYNAFVTIQGGINAVAAGGTVNVLAGQNAYASNLTIAKSMTLQGESIASTTITTGTNDFDPFGPGLNDTLIRVLANDVTIQNFTLDGDNSAISGGYIQNAKDVNIQTAISNDGYDTAPVVPVNNLKVLNNLIQNFTYAGISLDNDSGDASVGIVIDGNQIKNIQPAGSAVAGVGIGVLLYNNAYATVTDNDFDQVRIGVQTGNFSKAYTGNLADLVISGNSIESSARGIYFNLMYGATSKYTVENNTITTIINSLGEPLGQNNNAFGGINVRSIQGAVEVAFKNNTITGNGTANTIGYLVQNIQSPNVSISDDGAVNLISNVKSGVLVTNAVGDVSGGVALNGLNIATADTGIEINGNAAGSASASLNNIVINSSTTGLLLSGANANLIGNTLANTNFGASITGQYVTLTSGAANDTVITGTGAMYGVFNPNVLADAFAIEDKLTHGPDDTSLGLIRIQANQVYVTTVTPAVGLTDETIQNAIDVANPGDTVHLQAGTYTLSAPISITKAINLVGDGVVTFTAAVPLASLITVSGPSFVAADTVSITNINLDGAGNVNVGVTIQSEADLGTFTLSGLSAMSKATVKNFKYQGVLVNGSTIVSANVDNVNLTNLDFSNNGITGVSGTADIQFFGYNNNATLTNIVAVGNRNEGALTGAQSGIQFRGTGDQFGSGVAPMGSIILSNVDISGKYRTQMIGFQRYSSANLSMTGVKLGGAIALGDSIDSEITGTFGASLRFDAVGSGTITSPATVSLGNTLFRGLASTSAQRHEIEIAPDNNYTFLRVNGTVTQWVVLDPLNVPELKLAAGLSLAQAHAVEDRILHYVDKANPDHVSNPNWPGGLYKGFVDIQAENAFINDDVDLGGKVGDGSIQRGIDILAAGGIVHVEAGTFTENVTITKDIKLLGDTAGGTTLTAASGSLVTLSGNGFDTAVDLLAKNKVTIDWINLDGNTVADYGVRIQGSTTLQTFNLSNADILNFKINGVYVDASAYVGSDPSASSLVQNVNLTGLDLYNNGISGNGGMGDINFFGFNNNATLTNIRAVGNRTSEVGVGIGARTGIQFRGVGTNAGVGVLGMGSIAMTNVDVSGKYRNQMIGFQRYSTSNISFAGVKLGGDTNWDFSGPTISAITGGFGASLRFDAVGGSNISPTTIATPATVNLGTTLFRGLDSSSAQRHEIEIAPDNNHTFLRVNGLGTSWVVGMSTISASALDLAQAHGVEDRILHYVDKAHPTHGVYKGFVDIQSGNAFINDDADSGLVGDASIQRGIEIVAAGGTVNIEAGDYTGNVSTAAKAVTLAFNPGAAQATIVGDLTLDSDDTVSIDTINGTNPATEHDNIVVTGSANLGGALLSVPSISYLPQNDGDLIRLIDAATVTGTFNNYANAQSVNSGFRLYYTSGTVDLIRNRAPVAGNDFATAIEAGGVNNGTAGTNPTGNVLANDTDPDGIPPDTKTVTAVNFIVGMTSTPVPLGVPFNTTYGSLTIYANGSYAYLLDNNNPFVDGLAVGQTLTEVFTYTVKDSDNLTDTASLTITITGTNDTPVITVESGDSAAETLAETNAGLTTGGTLSVEDLDVSNVVNVAVSSVVESGTVSGIDNMTLLGMLTAGTNPIINNVSTTGTINWAFDSGLEAFDYLAVSESLVLTYTLTVTDSQSATDTQTVVITITGTNDTPVITVESGDSAAETLAETNAGLTTGGTLSVEDLDVSNVVNVAVSSVVESGTVSGIDNMTLLGMLTAGTNPIINNVSTTGTINWAFDSGLEAFDYLAVSESLVLTYTLTVTDSQSATDTQTVVITITGTNDTPTITVNNASVTFNEGSTATNSGTFGDLDQSNIVTLMASVGTVFDNLNGTWTWSYFVADGNLPPQTVTITATDNTLASTSTSFTLNVLNVAPTVSFGSSANSVNEGSLYTLSLGAVTDPGTDTISGYIVNWGDSSAPEFYSGSPAGKTHFKTYVEGNPTTYTITVSIIDEDGTHSGSTHNVSVHNVNPIGSFFNGGSVNEGSTGLVGFAGQFDPSTIDTAAQFRYAYDFNNDGIFEVGDGTWSGSSPSNLVTVPASFLNQGPGTRTVRGRIIDQDNGFTDYTTTITVNNVLPVVNAGPNATIGVNSLFTRSGSFTDPGADTWIAKVDYDTSDMVAAVPLALSGQTFVLNHTYTSTGVYNVQVSVSDDGGTTWQTGLFQVTVVPTRFQVSSVTVTASGFDIQFNRGADLSVLNLYDGRDISNDFADLTVTSGGNDVRGSLVWDAATSTAHWVKTGGVLAASTYTLFLRSDANGWKDTGGELLDGDNNGVAGGNYSQTFTVAPTSIPVLSLVDFARGPNQAVNVPATAAGLPLTISNGAGVQGVDFTLTYDPALLYIDTALTTLGAGLPSGWTVEFQTGTVPGNLVVSVYGSTPLGASPYTLINFKADVPSTAAYRASNLIRIENMSINEGLIAGRADDSIQKVAYFGDATGNGANYSISSPPVYSSLDASFIAQAVVDLTAFPNTNVGFDAYDLTDSVIIADVTGNGTLSALDASYISREVLSITTGGLSGTDQPEIPALPTAPLTAPPIVVGPDPKFVISTGITGVRGSTVNVPVQVPDSMLDLTGALGIDMVITYDTATLDLADPDVTLGGLVSSGWSISKFVSDGSGLIVVGLYSTTPHVPGTGVLLNLNFTVRADAPAGTTALNIVDNQTYVNEGQLPTTIIDGTFFLGIDTTINGAPTTSPEGTPISMTSSTVGNVGPIASYMWTVMKDGNPYTVTGNTSSSFTFTPNDNGSYVVSLAVVDGSGNTGTTSKAITVANVAPTLALGAAASINENGTATGTLTITDPGTLDTYTIQVNWGEGTPDTITVGLTNVASTTVGGTTYTWTAATRVLTVSHQYLDDNATDSYTLTFKVADDDMTGTFGGVASATNYVETSQTITVANVAPTITGVTYSATTINENGSVTVSGTVNDIGTADVITLTIVWGDGSSNTVLTGLTPGQTFSQSHTYVDDNPTATASDPYTLALTATDDDTGTSVTSSQVITVNNVAPTVNAGADTFALAGVSFSRIVSFGDIGTADTWKYSVDWNGDNIYDDINISTGLSSFTISHNYGPTDIGNTYNVTVKVEDDDLSVGYDTFVVQVFENTLRVTSVTQSPSGVTVNFNLPPVQADVNLYDSLLDGSPTILDAADITLIGSTLGNIKGSVVWNSPTSLTFVKTGGVLAPDSYTLTINSGSTAFHAASGNLDGDGDYNDGEVNDHYSQSFTVAATGPVLGIADFTRGPGQAVNVPATGLGLPITISDSTGVTSVSFTLTYDPALLDVTAVNLASGMPGDWAGSLTMTGPAGNKVITASGSMLTSGIQNLFVLTAQVPDAAPYRATNLITLNSVGLGGVTGEVGDSSIHKVAYFGDASGNIGYSAYDAALISRAITMMALDSGFDAYDLIDPVIIADINGNGMLGSMDASLVAQKAVGYAVAEIPVVPMLLSPIINLGVDPVVSIMSGISGKPGDIVNVPVTIDNGAGLLGVDLLINYDTASLDLTNLNVTLGSLLPGWTLTSTVVDSSGTIVVSAFSSNPLGTGGGNLFNLAFQIPVTATSGIANITIPNAPNVGALNEGGLAITPVSSFVTIDATAPTMDIVDVTPDPRTTPVNTISIVFSEPVVGFSLSDLVLKRNGGANLLTGSQTLTTSDNITWTLGNLSGLTTAAGNYVLSLADGSPLITDGVGNALSGGATESWTMNSTIAANGRNIFYNRSFFDGNDAAINANDDLAIATNKQALLPGQVATYSNYTNYSRGINGIMVDIANAAGTITLTDFTFKYGNNNTPSGWTTAATPIDFLVRPGAGVGGSDRVTIVWADNAIPNKNWLEVTVKASPTTTGLATDDVFYFGNSIGETGNSVSNTNVDATDEIAARNNPKNSLLGFATVTNVHDFNKDRSVNATDELIARNNPANTLAGRLNLIDLTAFTLTSMQVASVIVESAPAAQTTALSVVAPVEMQVVATNESAPTVATIADETSFRKQSMVETSNNSPSTLPSSSLLKNSSEWLVLSSAHAMANLVNAFKASGSVNKAHAAVWASFDFQDDDQPGLIDATDNSYGNEYAMNWEQQTNTRTTKRDKATWFSEDQVDEVLDATI